MDHLVVKHKYHFTTIEVPKGSQKAENRGRHINDLNRGGCMGGSSNPELMPGRVDWMMFGEWEVTPYLQKRDYAQKYQQQFMTVLYFLSQFYDP